MKKICVLTATRAEYGLLKNVILKLQKHFDVKVIVTGMHLSQEFGLTYKEIERDNIKIHKKIEILLSADSESAVSKSMALALISFSDYFATEKPDYLLLLGDRYETLAVAIAAFNFRIPIIHLYGGEKTEGAIDESMRHAITKFSHIHFTSTKQYKKRVIQLGESPNTVFNVGSLGVENVLTTKLLSKQELQNELKFNLNKPYAVVTFHPVTLENNSSKIQFLNLLNAIKKFDNLNFIFTKANADMNGKIINCMIDKFVANNKNAVAFKSLGTKKYLSALKYCKFVIGNSSSAIIEAPCFNIYTINIGDRQKGRIQANSIINCKPTEVDIFNTINYVLLNKLSKKVMNPYNSNNTSTKIVHTIINNSNIKLKKEFYDL